MFVIPVGTVLPEFELRPVLVMMPLQIFEVWRTELRASLGLQFRAYGFEVCAVEFRDKVFRSRIWDCFPDLRPFRILVFLCRNLRGLLHGFLLGFM